MTKYMDDGLQIVEQIMPYFDPTVNLKITNVEKTCAVNDVQLSLDGSPELVDNFNDLFDTSRMFVWRFNITAHTHLYKPVHEQRVIRTVEIDFDHMEPRYDLEVMTIEAHPDEYSDPENSTITREIG